MEKGVDFKTKIKAAKLGLLVSKRHCFFGSLLLPFKVTVLDIPGTAVTKAVSGNREVVISKGFLDSLDVQGLKFIFVHELVHILEGHGERDVSGIFPADYDARVRDYIRLLAADHCVNLIVSKAGIPILEDSFIIDDLKYTDSTFASAVRWLVENTSKVGEKAKIEMEFGNIIVLEVEFTNGETREIVISTGEVDKVTEQEVKSEARALEERGLLDASFADQIRRLLKVKVPWDEIIIDWLYSQLQVQTSMRTWKYLNKRLFLYALLPGRKYSEEANYGIAIFVLDTSGSMSLNDIRKMLKIVQVISGKFRKIYIIQHSVRVKHITEIDITSPLEEEELIRQIKGIYGRGGTSHHEVFKKIEEIYEEYPDELSGVAIMTDGYSDLETVWPQFKWTQVIPSVFIMNSSKTLPFSRTVRIDAWSDR